MKILRYSPDIQKQIGSKVKAEPWMHIGFTDGHYAIWIWDTRQIIGTGTADESKVNGTPAKDNHKPLTGEHAEAFVLTRRGAHKPVNMKQNYIAIAGYRQNGATGHSTGGKLVHSVEEAFAIARQRGTVFNWADAKDITSTFVKDRSALHKKYGLAQREQYLEEFKKTMGDCKIYYIGKAIAEKPGQKDWKAKLEQNYADSTPPPAGMRFYALIGYHPAECYCISDGSKLNLFTKAL